MHCWKMANMASIAISHISSIHENGSNGLNPSSSSAFNLAHSGDANTRLIVRCRSCICKVCFRKKGRKEGGILLQSEVELGN